MTRAGLAGAVALLVLLTAAPAAAEPGVRIRGAESVDGRLSVVVSGTDLSAEGLDPSSVSLHVDGQSVPATAASVAAQTAAPQRRVVMVVDTSGSMRGSGLAGAKDAARSFLTAVPADVQVGLVSFSDSATVTVPPNADRGPLLAAVDALVASGETALYDGVLAGVSAAGADGLRSLLVLSDGADTASAGTLEAARGAVSAAGLRLDAVAFRTDEATGDVLQDLASSSGGRLLDATDPGALVAAFAAAAQELAGELVVTADLPPELSSRQAVVRVTVASGGQQLSDEVVALLSAAASAPVDPAALAAPRTVPDDEGFWGSDASLRLALGGVFVGLVVLLAFLLGATSPRARNSARTRKLLGRYTLTGRSGKQERETTALGDSSIAVSAVELAGRVAQRRGIDERLTMKLDRAAVPLRPAEWLLICAGVIAGVLLLLVLLTGSLLFALGCAVASGFAPGLWLSIKASRRRAAFLESMPDSLQLLAGSLMAGFSLPQAVDAVAREGSEPLAGEFGRAVAESRLGVPMEDALDAVADRMDSEDFRWVVMAVRVQREVGGNLAEVLQTVAGTMRDRASLRRQVRALSAEGRLSAYVLIGLPIAMTLYLVSFRRDYLRPLYTETLGIVMIVFAVVLTVIGSIWMSRIVKVEV